MLEAGRTLLQDTARAYGEDNVPRMGAALAFYTVLSLAPLFVIALGISSIVFERQQVQTEVAAQLHSLIGDAGDEVIDLLFTNAFDAYGARSGIIASLIGFGVLFFVASAVLNELRESLDAIWNVGKGHRGGIMNAVWGRVVSLALVLGIGFLLLTSLLLSAALAAFTRFLSKGLMMPAVLVGAFDAVINIVLLSLLFALLYKFLPDIPLTWRDVGPGAVVTALLFTVGKWAIGIFIGNSVVGSAYGAAGSLVVFLLWVFFTAQLFFLGAEFGKAYALRYGSLRRHREAPEGDGFERGGPGEAAPGGKLDKGVKGEGASEGGPA